MNQTSRQKKIVVLSTGGTIAGSGVPGMASEYRAGQISAEEILQTIPQVKDLAEIQVEEVCALDSNDITFQHYAALKKRIEELDQDPEVDGIVITHGTDTLEESAFLLNLVLDTNKPVVLTGAMRPATAASPDGPMNLYQAIALACSKDAHGMGVLAVFSGSIYGGRDLTKISSLKIDAFKTSEFGKLGYMRDDQAVMIQAPYRIHTKRSQFTGLNLEAMPAVEIFYVHQQSDPDLLKWMLKKYDGIILAGTGGGNYSRDIQKVIEENQEQCVIVRTSRLTEGAAFESEVFDPQQITIPAYRLSPHKARLLLMLALKAGLSHKEIQTVFQQY